jgi:hypothetical protein
MAASSKIISASQAWRCWAKKKWKREAIYTVAQLKRSLIADYVVLGGGNVGRFDKLPKDVEPGKN